MSNYLPLIVRDTLLKTDWSENEVAAYSALLEKGAMGLTDMSTETGIPVSTLQHIIKKLMLKKMLTKNMVNGKPVYSASDVDQLRKWVKGYSKQFEQYQDIMSKFVDQYDFNPQMYTPKVRFYEGVNGVKQSYRQILEEATAKQINSILAVKDFSSLKDFFLDEYIPLRIKKEVKINNIAVESSEGQLYKENDAESLRETKLVPKHVFPELDTEINLYGDHMHLMSYPENKGVFSMIIKDKNLVSILQSVFKMLWFSSEKITFFEGIEGVKDSYLYMVENCKGKEILGAFSVVESVQPDLQSFFEKVYVRKRVQKGINMKNIALDSHKSRQYQKKDNEELRQTLLVDEESLPMLNSEINIYDNSLHCMSFDEKGGFALIINDKDMTSILKGLFMIAWKSLENGKN